MKKRVSTLTADADDPIGAINTTPLIDVMLVLLIMFIITIPLSTHKVPLDLPGTPPNPPTEQPPPIVHRLGIDAAGALHWNGRAIDEAQLRALLARVAADPTLPELHLAADAEARYERVDQTLAAIARAGVTRMGFVGNERFAAALDR